MAKFERKPNSGALFINNRKKHDLQPDFQGGIKISDDLLDAIGVDTVGTDAISTFFGFPPEDWKPWKTPWGQDVLVPGKFNVTQNEKGIYIYPEGDTSIAPSAHMPTASFFFDTIFRQLEIDDNNLNPEDNLDEFKPLTDDQLAKIKAPASSAPRNPAQLQPWHGL